jgi:signal transduction histidine kinase
VIKFVKLSRELRVKTDPLRVQQIVINLLQNAIKFSPENSEVIVQISLGFDQIQKGNITVRIQVTD